ncbi:MAG TPA: malectin domain-containing carbohydrate-binding protein, partial [Planctomycetota bacterium]|nr:malectin domain-containing carbohydrate-binding protein [Planctomycetota bacterium]
YNLACAYLRQRRFAEAAAEYLEAEKHGIQDATLYGNLGTCLVWMGKESDALKAHARAIELDPEIARYYFNLGSAQVWLGNVTDALEMYGHAARLAPNSPITRNDHGYALERAGRLARAHAEYQESIRIKRGHVPAQHNAAALLLGSDLPWPSLAELPGAIRRIETVEHVEHSATPSRAIKWLLQRHRQALLPGIASVASIDAAFAEAPLVAEGSEYSYFRGTREPAAGLEWTEPSFPDSNWEIGRGPLGYPKDWGIATPLENMDGQYSSVYLRCRFTVEDPRRIENLVLSIRADDGFIAYLNGKEAARFRAGEPETTPSSDALADSRDTSRWSAFDFQIGSQLLLPGENLLAVRGLNGALEDDDFALSPVLTTTWTFDEERRLDLERMLRAFQAHAEAEGQDASALTAYFEGRLLQAGGGCREAEALFRQAAALAPTRPEPLLRAAECLRAAGQPAVAEQLLHGALNAAASTGLERQDLLLEAWLHHCFLDPEWSPAEILAAFPPLESLTPSPSPQFHPHRDDDLHWLVKTLAADGVLRINCGGARFRDTQGRSWSEDRFYRAGWPEFLRELDARKVRIPESALQKTTRWFFEARPVLEGYKIPLPVGRYRVDLHFLEGELRKTGMRQFDIVLEGVIRQAGYEPLNAGFGVPNILTFELPVTDGTLDLDFTRRVGDPQIIGMVIQPL